MRLEALTAGIGAEANAFSGAVHSVFVRAGNIALESGKLLGLVASELGAVPCGFQLATPSGFSFLEHVRIGARASCRGGLLRIDNSALSIDLRPARPWRSGLGELAIDLADPETAGAWHRVWAAMAEHGGASGFARAAALPIADLCRAARARRGRDVAPAITRLVGLGEGLTPAGDDFLVGFLAGQWSTVGASESGRAFAATLAMSIARAATATNAISRSYLEAAAAGEVAEPLAFLAQCLGRGDAGRAVIAARLTLSVGASSGAAGVCGLLLGVRAGTGDAATPLQPDIRYLAEGTNARRL